MNNEGSGQTNPTTQPPNNDQNKPMQWKPFVPIVNIDNGPDFKNKSTELVKEIEDIIKGNASSSVTPTNQDKEVMQIAHSAMEIRAYSMGIITYFVSNSLILPSKLFTWANLTPKARSLISFGTSLVVAAYGRFNTPPFTILEAYLSLNSDLGKYARDRSMQTFPSSSYFNQKYNPPIVPNQQPQFDYNSTSTSHHQQYASHPQRNEGEARFTPQTSMSPYSSSVNDYNSRPNPYSQQPSYQSYDDNNNGSGYSYKEGKSSYSPSYSSPPPTTPQVSKRDAARESFDSFDDRFDDSYANRTSSSSSYYDEDQLYSEPDDLDEYSGSSESEFERMNRLRREKLLSRSR